MPFLFLLNLCFLLPSNQLLFKAFNFLLELLYSGNFLTNLFLGPTNLWLFPTYCIFGFEYFSLKCMSLICDSSRGRIPFVKRGIMWIIESKSVRYVLISLKFDGILYNLDGNTDHWSNLGHYIFTHGFGSVAVPFVTLTILHDSWLSFVDNFSLVDSLLEHFIGIVFYFLCRRFDNFLFSLLDDIFIGSKIGREFLLNHFSWLDGELFYFIIQGSSQSLKRCKNLPYDILLL